MKQSQPLRGKLSYNEMMSKHTTWRVGGAADQYFKPVDQNDLSIFLSTVPIGTPIYWFGLGSNVLVRDGGIRGVVIATKGTLTHLQKMDDHTVYAEAGVTCAKMARFCAQHNLFGIEFMAGIPGTIGGALAMNAGAHAKETWNYVIEAQTIDRTGKIICRLPRDFTIRYREVKLPENEWFVGAKFRIEDESGGKELIKQFLTKRNESQPADQFNAGSVFRNPENDFAARLIESAGLKGKTLGGAQVSKKHANFIINTGSATARDIEDLIQYIESTVAQKHNVQLQREVHIIGEPVS